LNKQRRWVWAARFLIGIVLIINLMCAIDFMARPKLYMGGYELRGEVGRAVVVGYGILFFMWQVPYFFAVFDPVKQNISLISAVLMQTIGLVGESLLYRMIPLEHKVLRGSVMRFIIFDGAGLVLLLAALGLSLGLARNKPGLKSK
jgi:hypothetical protein